MIDKKQNLNINVSEGLIKYQVFTEFFNNI